MRSGKLNLARDHGLRARWGRLREDFVRWVTRRHQTDGRRARVTRDRVYILPTRQGYMLLLILLVMLLGSINYSNNMAFLLTFLIVGIGHNAMWYTHRNLLGLKVTVLPVKPAFAGAPPVLALRLEEPDGRPREALRLAAGGRESPPAFLEPGASVDVAIALEARPRGIYRLPRQRLSTRYPLGLLEAWTWLTLDTEVVVYPVPIPADAMQAAATDGDGEETTVPAARDALPDEIRDYRPGDSPNRIAWKAVARSGRLFVRDSAGGEAAPTWLDWDAVPGADPEYRLSVLCHLVLEANAAGQPFGLRLPGQRLGPDAGPDHLGRCLRALALFGLPGRNPA
ncbi:DUF58 domain-containing protein [Thioalkalivibrio sp.]|uniref:DUF58 domain-containing protein n=1 Tax=Thioalkalivibrio sp. TaxID=2093813 RepID=UPI0012D6EF59|nr:DUF58 domain-containing protein [Thioalkalivibrio sp.]TVP81469.1 MAG: DUF58 domain-containing protein [Thioalkalivibrio sp.]